MNEPEQPTIFHFCGECANMRPGSTMHECDHFGNGERTSLVLPDLPACEDFRQGKHRYRVSPLGLIEKEPDTP